MGGLNVLLLLALLVKAAVTRGKVTVVAPDDWVYSFAAAPHSVFLGAQNGTQLGELELKVPTRQDYQEYCNNIRQYKKDGVLPSPNNTLSVKFGKCVVFHRIIEESVDENPFIHTCPELTERWNDETSRVLPQIGFYPAKAHIILVEPAYNNGWGWGALNQEPGKFKWAYDPHPWLRVNAFLEAEPGVDRANGALALMNRLLSTEETVVKVQITVDENPWAAHFEKTRWIFAGVFPIFMCSLSVRSLYFYWVRRALGKLTSYQRFVLLSTALSMLILATYNFIDGYGTVGAIALRYRVFFLTNFLGLATACDFIIACMFNNVVSKTRLAKNQAFATSNSKFTAVAFVAFVLEFVSIFVVWYIGLGMLAMLIVIILVILGIFIAIHLFLSTRNILKLLLVNRPRI